MKPNEKPHVVIGTIPYFAHLEKAKVIGASLIKRGYDVTIVTGNCARKEVEDIGANFAPMKGRADLDTAPRGMPSSFDRDWEAWALARIVDMIPDQYESVRDLLEDIYQREGTDRRVVYMDDIACGAMFPVYFGAPGAIWPKGVLKIGTVPLPHESVDIPPWGSGLTPCPPEAGSTQNNTLSAKQGIYKSEDLHSHYREVLRATGVPINELEQLPHFISCHGACCDRYLALSIPEFEYPRSDLPEFVQFIGALPSVGRTQECPDLPGWWDEVIHTPEKRKPIIVITQGSVHNDPKQLILPTIEALKDEDVTVIVTLLRDSDSTLDLPSNVKVAKFIPFDILLEYTTVLVSNGGFGGVQHALSRGVPMVLAGLFFDKADTNARAAWMGAAINLACETVHPDQIREAVQSILCDPQRIERCLQIKQEYAKYDALSQIAAAVDEVAETR